MAAANLDCCEAAGATLCVAALMYPDQVPQPPDAAYADLDDADEKGGVRALKSSLGDISEGEEGEGVERPAVAHAKTGNLDLAHRLAIKVGLVSGDDECL